MGKEAYVAAIRRDGFENIEDVALGLVIKMTDESWLCDPQFGGSNIFYPENS